jgi:hypothetical protein
MTKAMASIVLAFLCVVAPFLSRQGEAAANKLRIVHVVLQDEGNKCEVAWVEPDNISVGMGDTIAWNITNQCSPSNSSKTISIENRRPKYPKQHPGLQPKEDPLKLKDCKTAIPNDGQPHALSCDLNAAVSPRLYKYDIRGDVKLDPELEVRNPPPPPPIQQRAQDELSTKKKAPVKPKLKGQLPKKN